MRDKLLRHASPSSGLGSSLRSIFGPVLVLSRHRKRVLPAGKSVISSISIPAREFSSTCHVPGLTQIQHSAASGRAFIFRSSSTDPYLNLSLEHYLLQHAHPESRVLFLYVNRPCVVIGRNQNPWVECALQRIFREPVPVPVSADGGARTVGSTGSGIGGSGGVGSLGSGEVLLVRRRSGGGAVFHDEGNLNYSVIVPNHAKAEFKRKTHAEMVVRAVKGVQQGLGLYSTPFAGIEAAEDPDCRPDTSAEGAMNVRVNERNDIVMGDRQRGVLKVSGSAFKLTKGRALHHGTLLFSSPNLKNIGEFLQSPAREFISAKGVESVRSPVGNLFDQISDARYRSMLRGRLENSIVDEFGNMYGEEANGRIDFSRDGLETKRRESLEDISSGIDESKGIGAEIMKGVREMMSAEWTFEQTPGFLISTKPAEGEKAFSPPINPAGIPEGASVFFRVRNGSMQEVEVSLSNAEGAVMQEKQQIKSRLLGRKLHEISDWKAIFDGLDAWTRPETPKLVVWLTRLFPPLSINGSMGTSQPGLTREKTEDETREAHVFKRRKASGITEVEVDGEQVVEEIPSRGGGSMTGKSRP